MKIQDSGFRSFSFEGQDMIIASLLREVDKGFFMDIGCNHPIHENNTFRLYEAGWC